MSISLLRWSMPTKQRSGSFDFEFQTTPRLDYEKVITNFFYREVKRREKLCSIVELSTGSTHEIIPGKSFTVTLKGHVTYIVEGESL